MRKEKCVGNMEGCKNYAQTGNFEGISRRLSPRNATARWQEVVELWDVKNTQRSLV